jgi:hypothetical protein
MGFSAKQVKALQRRLDQRYVRTREANGRQLSYIEGWYAISEANRIFGFDGWSRETIESRCVLARENRGAFLTVYAARVRISVLARLSFARVMDQARAVAPPPAKSTTPHLRLQKPMRPSERSRPSAGLLVLSFIARKKRRTRKAKSPCGRHPRICIPSRARDCTQMIRRRSHARRTITAGGMATR